MTSRVAPSIENVRQKGQVWTPPWVADAMAEFLKDCSADSVLDPAMGPGALLAAVRRKTAKLGPITAFEIDESVLCVSDSEDSFAIDGCTDLRLKDFLFDTEDLSVAAVIANPPYLRHHKIPPDLKARCQEIAKQTLGIKIDARAGLHIFFLIKALSHLKPFGKLSFLVPADTFEGVFSVPLWKAISSRFNVVGVLTFDESVAAFPGVDTNASIVFVERTSPNDSFKWMNWKGEHPRHLSSATSLALSGELGKAEQKGLVVAEKSLDEAIEIGFSRLNSIKPVGGVSLNEFATMMRGVASGSNEFFLMTKERLDELKLDESYFVRTIPRVRDASEPTITQHLLDVLDANGRPTYLLSIDETTDIDKHLEEYLSSGIRQGVDNGALVSMRKRWFFMEKRKPVPILFAYLGRRSNRFIEAKTDITPLTGFLCVYPKPGVDHKKLLKALNHPSSIKELARIGKSYGDGAIKVEPGGLRKMIIPKEALVESGLKI